MESKTNPKVSEPAISASALNSGFELPTLPEDVWRLIFDALTGGHHGCRDAVDSHLRTVRAVSRRLRQLAINYIPCATIATFDDYKSMLDRLFEKPGDAPRPLSSFRLVFDVRRDPRIDIEAVPLISLLSRISSLSLSLLWKTTTLVPMAVPAGPCPYIMTALCHLSNLSSLAITGPPTRMYLPRPLLSLMVSKSRNLERLHLRSVVIGFAPERPANHHHSSPITLSAQGLWIYATPECSNTPFYPLDPSLADGLWDRIFARPPANLTSICLHDVRIVWGDVFLSRAARSLRRLVLVRSLESGDVYVPLAGNDVKAKLRGCQLDNLQDLCALFDQSKSYADEGVSERPSNISRLQIWLRTDDIDNTFPSRRRQLASASSSFATSFVPPVHTSLFGQLPSPTTSSATTFSTTPDPRPCAPGLATLYPKLEELYLSRTESQDDPAMAQHVSALIVRLEEGPLPPKLRMITVQARLTAPAETESSLEVLESLAPLRFFCGQHDIRLRVDDSGPEVCF